MALEFLFKDSVEDGKELARHPEATHFGVQSGEIKQYRVNPCPHSWMFEFPLSCNSFEIKRYQDCRREYHDRIEGNINYGEIVFYNHKHNILNTIKLSY